MLVSVPRQSASGGLYLQAVATPQMEAARKLFEGGVMSTVSIRSITPILIVRAIEPCLEFWQKLGSKVIAQVPRADVIGFLWFSLGEQTVMLQTEDSAEADVKISPKAGGGVVYLDVTDIAAVENTVDPQSIVLPKRVTDYGSTEIWVREPGGNLIGFAQHAE